MMTPTQIKALARQKIKVLPGGPADNSAGTRGAGMIALIDAIVDYLAEPLEPADPASAVLTALTATSFEVELAVAHPLDLSRYRLRAIPKPGDGGTTPPTQPPAPSGFTVDSERQAAFEPDAQTDFTDYEYQIEE